MPSECQLDHKLEEIYSLENISEYSLGYFVDQSFVRAIGRDLKNIFQMDFVYIKFNNNTIWYHKTNQLKNYLAMRFHLTKSGEFKESFESIANHFWIYKKCQGVLFSYRHLFLFNPNDHLYF